MVNQFVDENLNKIPKEEVARIIIYRHIAGNQWYDHLEGEPCFYCGTPKKILNAETIYTVPLHVGCNVEVPDYCKGHITYYSPSRKQKQLFETKPNMIKAIQWKGNNLPDIYDFVGSSNKHLIFGPFHNQGIAIKTLKGVMSVRKEFWIIEGLQGEFYPCEPDIFEAKYKLLSEQI